MECTNIFHQNLTKQWKSKAYCGREYYRTAEIVRWMLRRDPAQPRSNVELLLTEAYYQSGSLRHPSSEEISDGEERCLVVFAILLELNYGHLIDIFQRWKIIDKRLPMHDGSFTRTHLEIKLKESGIENAKSLSECFLEKAWLYCPCRVEFGMNDAFLDPDHGRWIMPFCKRQPINVRGGAAQVWEVAIQESLVDRKLAMAAGRSAYMDEEHGPCYVFALKTFTEESLQIFRWEKEAYLTVQAKKLPGMVKFLGEYEIDEQLEDGGVGHTWNMLLEYGEENLDEFFASQRNYPPSLNPEIIQFWNSLANVGQVLDSIHNLEYGRENGHIFRWHGDLKPDNILRVDGELKLANLGLAKFKARDPGEVQKQHITGRTGTYGAPECDRVRLDSTISLSQAIDTWSFGCILSISATWIALGYQGIRAYDELRRIAVKKLRERKGKGENITLPAADNAFHDGVDVLPEVRDWHTYLRKVLRVTDTVTGRILDLVDQTMLLRESTRRSKCSGLYNAIQGQLNDAQDHYDRLVKKGELKHIAESVKEALLSVEDEENALANYCTLDTDTTSSSFQYLISSVERHPSLGPRRIDKSKKVNEVTQGRVAHRQEALREQRSITTQASRENPEKENDYPESNNSFAWPWLLGRKEPQGRRSCASHNSIRSISYPLDPSAIPKPLNIPNEKEVQIFELPGSPTSNYESSLSSAYPRNDKSLTESPVREELYLGTKPQLEDHRRVTSEGRTSTISGLEPYIARPISLISSQSNQTSLDPSWPICQEHQALKSKKKGFKAFFSRNQDEYLKKFLFDRDITFLVDNDMTMSSSWEAMTTALETLVSKVGSLDKNGLDLEFTLGNAHNVHNVSSRQLLARFRDAKKDALSQNYNLNTNMAKTLTRIFDKYLSDTRRAKTLIVLTNGVWGGTINPTDVEMAIAGFLRKPALAQKLERRWFTIQFIACGDQVPDILRHLDDNLEDKYSIPDVIDTEHISGNVYKMILGSFVDEFDVATSC
ncbi:hypothetical protein F5B19DRAFT_468927 [Rostrohypoxylon terebratum]|nr:hypothetical protein F5B19DRAFT_468927 [Rostrohypoxylon terebratum]